MVEVGEAAVIVGHAAGGMRDGGECNEQDTPPTVEPVTEDTPGGPESGASEDGDGMGVEEDTGEGGSSHPLGQAESQVNWE